MNTKKVLMKRKTIMKPMRRFNHLKLHTDNKYNYYIFPITSHKLNEIKEGYLDEPFTINIDKYIISGDDIILFGK